MPARASAPSCRLFSLYLSGMAPDRFHKPRRTLRIWPFQLAVGQSLPTLPLWLETDFAVPLELEASYEHTCRVLRIV